jgi:formylglycine-generating enzyme required for sulfatase activity
LKNPLVVIVAHRYGWVLPDQPSGEYKSITWLECEHAVAEHKAVEKGRATLQLLDEVQRNVSLLRDFKNWLNARGIRAVFTTPEDLRGKILAAITDWRRRHSEFDGTETKIRTTPADPSLYLQALRERTAYIDIRGLQVGTGKAHRFPIEELYIPLATNAPSEEMTIQRRKRGKQAQTDEPTFATHTPVPLHAVLRPACRVVVVGDPDSGKTTFLRRVAHTLCQTHLSEVPNAAETRLGIRDAPLPILVRLAGLAEYIARSREIKSISHPTTWESAAWLPHYLAAESRDEQWGLDDAYFRAQLEGGAYLLLDGLDEAPNRPTRKLLVQMAERVAAVYKSCRLIVTTRPPTYTGEAVLPSFMHVHIEPLDDDAIRTFLEHWCQALFPDSPTEVASHLGDLIKALHSRPEIRRLARNPVMLTALAVVHWNERRLPEQRADLYESIIKWLSRSREQRPGRLPAERCVALLQELALAMQNHPDGRQVQVTKRWAAEAIAGEMSVAGRPQGISKDGIEQADQFLDEEELDSGIVAGRGNEICFWHPTFQEYLAAKAIAGRLEAEQQRLLWDKQKKLYQPEWREVGLLLAGVLHQQGRLKVDGFVKAVLDNLSQPSSLAEQARCVGLLGAVLRDLLQYEVVDPRYPDLLSQVLAIFDKQRASLIPIEVRIEAANALGQAGDPRLDRSSPHYWVSIPAGKFLMGAQNKEPSGPNYDPEAHVSESPVHKVDLDAYRIARYLVTVGEYQQFMERDGYADPQWWERGSFGQWQAPAGWEEQLAFPNRPVVGVSWFEAVAYCVWAGSRLPTEAEWERAARGTEGRRFPWGNEPPDADRLNYRHPTPVGVYPHGATPDGIQDMAGNVWEWTQSILRDYRHPTDENERAQRDNRCATEGKPRMLRGGAGWLYRRDLRCAFRVRGHPDDRVRGIGFRVVLLP